MMVVCFKTATNSPRGFWPSYRNHQNGMADLPTGVCPGRSCFLHRSLRCAINGCIRLSLCHNNLDGTWVIPDVTVSDSYIHICYRPFWSSSQSVLEVELFLLVTVTFTDYLSSNAVIP